MRQRPRFRPLLRLVLLCAAAAVLLCGCGKAPEKEAAPTATPIPAKTANPRLSEGFRRLEEQLLAGASAALQLENRVLSENSAVSSVRVPDQVVNQFLDALADEAAWKHEAGKYTLSVDSSGNYVYEKPYSELITGSSTDVYTIENEDGWVEEIVDNTRFDPFTWVMSGEGGGAFAYMTVYELQEDGNSGTVETVSRLNENISGWSYDAFDTHSGSYRFVDLQLSPDEEGQIASPYRWILCLGEIGANAARIEEIGLETAELSLPLNGLSLAEPAETLIRRAESLGRLETLLTLEDGKVTYTEYGQGK